MANPAYALHDSGPAAAAPGDLARRLQAPRERIEGAFLEIGGRLDEAATLLGGIMSVLDSLPEQLEGDQVLSASAKLQQIVADAAGMGHDLAAEQAGLAELAKLLLGVQNPIADLSNGVRAIGMVALNARVAAGYLSGATDVTVFTSDISELARHASSTIKDFAAVYQRLKGAVAGANAERDQFETDQRDALQHLSAKITASLSDMAAYRGRSAQAGAALKALSDNISDGVGRAVFALQIGDISRQRVEHVEEALANLATLDLKDPASQALSGAVCRLQAAQLAVTVENFDREVAGLFASLEALAGAAGENVQLSRATYGGGDATGKSFLDELARDLREACALMRATQAACASLDATARTVADSMADLVRHVQAIQSIEFEMRLVSLNMTLKCSHLGQEGRTLKVIAHELGLLVGSTVTAADAVIAALREGEAAAQSLNVASGEATLARVRRLEEDAADAISLLEQVDGGIAEGLAQVAADGGRLKSVLDAAAGAAVVQAQISHALRETLAALQQAAEKAGDEPVDPEAVRRITGRYTMESERALHEQVLGRAAAAPGAAGGQDLDSVFL